MSNLIRGPSIDASYQVSVYLAKRFQRRRFKCENVMDEGHQVMAKTHMRTKKNCIQIKTRSKKRKFSFSVVGTFRLHLTS